MVSEKFVLNLGTQLNVERAARLAAEARISELETRLQTLEEKVKAMEQREQEREAHYSRILTGLTVYGGEE